MKQTFQIVIADPPWGAFNDKLKMSDVKRGAEANYSTMTTVQIMTLPIKEITDPKGAILALWVPASILQDGLDVMKAWGFEQKQIYVWAKIKKNPFGELSKIFGQLLKKKQSIVSNLHQTFLDLLQEAIYQVSLVNFLSFGLGRLFRSCNEVCLIGVNNTGIYKQLMNKSQRSMCFAPNLGHSIKPEALQDSLELMFPNSVGHRVELFARRQRPGWICLGNALFPYEDIKVSLRRLIDVSNEENAPA
jgi:N6-adenosine-specific RNA methylase IME4